MYDLSHDLIGTLSPVLVMLTTMMIAGGSGGGSSYAFSGKTDDIDFLLIKARAAARKIRCPHRRNGNGLVLNGGPPISYAEFFDLSARPSDITAEVWKDMSETAFDVIISFINDPRHQRLVKGCDRDGGKLLTKLKAIGGSKRQQVKTLDGIGNFTLLHWNLPNRYVTLELSEPVPVRLRASEGGRYSDDFVHIIAEQRQKVRQNGGFAGARSAKDGQVRVVDREEGARPVGQVGIARHRSATTIFRKLAQYPRVPAGLDE